MSRDSGWLALLAVPVLCCAGHAVLLAVGVGSITSLVGGVAGSAAIAAAGLLVLFATAVALRRRRRPESAAVPTKHAARTPDGGHR